MQLAGRKKKGKGSFWLAPSYTSKTSVRACVRASMRACPPVHQLEEWQTDEQRQTHDQMQRGPGAAEPGQWGHGHRPQAKAEGQEGRGPEAA